MKKSLLALTVLGVLAGAAQAQSSVTVYGSLDGGIRHLTNANATGDSVLGMSNGIISSGISNSNRLGFKGVEDLGGGMNAHFVLESGFILGRGAFTGATPTLFSRQAFVGLTGSLGELDLGRQYSIALKQLGSYDPFLYKFPTIVPLAFAASADPASGGRFNNDIQYIKNFGPLTARVEYALGENPGSVGNGSSQAAGLHYESGGIAVGGAFTRRKPLVGATYENNDQWLIGGAYATGPYRVALGYIDEQQDVGSAKAKIRNLWLGGSYNFTPALKLTGGFYRTKNTTTAGVDGKRDLFIVAGSYALSKRTDLYLEVDRAKFTSAFSNQYTASPIGIPAGAANGLLSQTGISMGMNHTF
ncbi:porin [Herbaspirillum sp. ST 5-3]|uniref:porin n=1 Tax=Oxalobacteraceae TaxID=75682 RepID=UPI0010A33C58|nr:porin [Herbaspirillum sp. ST 5-3]